MPFRLNRALSFASGSILILAIIGCGGSGGPDAPPDINISATDVPDATNQPEPNPIRFGRFIDSPVAGLNYRSGDIEGVTDADGSFRYRLGTTVEFSIGDIIIGQIEGRPLVTPLDLVADAADTGDQRVLNLTRLLQTLDHDKNPDNGITLPTEATDLQLGMNLNFSQAPDQFNQAITAILAALDMSTSEHELISADIAKAHLDKYVNGYSYLDQLRAKAGMISFTNNEFLVQAAINHADYLITNRTSGHVETEGRPKFTGTKPADRAGHAGYPARFVGEGISTGDSANDAIDRLMSGIYHRLDLLSMVHDQLGIGFQRLSDTPGAAVLVHNIGNSEIDKLCRQTKELTGPGIYVNACTSGIRIAKADYDSAIDAIAKRNPPFVLWPPKDATDIPPAFFEETPDPLPDRSVSGYPLSIQFNPYYFEHVDLIDFKVYDDHSGAEIDNTRLLHEISDPQQKLSKLEYVLYPLQRLNWGTRYRAELSYSVNGVVEQIQWRFTTRTIEGAAVVTMPNAGGQTEVVSGNDYAVYLPPRNGDDLLGEINVAFPEDMQVFLDYEDLNTIRVTVIGSAGQRATLSFSDGRQWVLVVHHE